MARAKSSVQDNISKSKTGIDMTFGLGFSQPSNNIEKPKEDTYNIEETHPSTPENQVDSNFNYNAGAVSEPTTAYIEKEEVKESTPVEVSKQSEPEKYSTVSTPDTSNTIDNNTAQNNIITSNEVVEEIYKNDTHKILEATSTSIDPEESSSENAQIQKFKTVVNKVPEHKTSKLKKPKNIKKDETIHKISALISTDAKNNLEKYAKMYGYKKLSPFINDLFEHLDAYMDDDE